MRGQRQALIGLATLILAWLGSLSLGAQAAPSETEPGLADTVIGLSDTLGTAAAKLDSLFYAADSVAYHYDTEQIYLYGNTSVQYQTSTISADSLRIDLKKDRAFSSGRTVMQDNDQVLIGSEVRYDVNSQTGVLQDAASRLDKGFYYGREVRKIGDGIYDIDDGRFTTCDDQEPDFWFQSRRMRLYQGDKIVGKPVVAYVNHMPIFYFPYITFSIKRGRQLGLLIPEPGYNTVDGRYIRNIAFYYPWKDYADATIALDLMEKTGWKVNLETRYAKRYLLNGNFDTSLQKNISGYATNVDYSIRGSHHQELGEKSTFDANIDYISNKRIWESSTDIDESLAQRITSTLSYRRPLLSSYLNAGATYSEDLINNTVNVSLPSATFSLPTRPVHEIFTRKSGLEVRNKWWTNFNYSYNVRLDHTGYLRAKSRDWSDYLWDNTLDSTGVSYLNEHHLGLKHNLGLNYSYKAFGWLNLTQAFSYGEAWMDRDRNDDKWVRGNEYSASSSANFTVYGIRNLPEFYVSSVLHIITPSVSFGYSPDFSGNDRFYYFGGIGLNQSERSRNISLGLDQKWQIKLKATDKAKERKLTDVFGWSARTGLNLEKKERQFNNLTHSFYFRPAAYETGRLKLNYSSSYNLSQDPYQLHWLNWKPGSQYFSHSLQVSGSASYKDYFPRRKSDLFSAYVPVEDSVGGQPIPASATALSADWSLSLSQDLSTDRNILHPRNNNLRLSAACKLTSNWELSYSSYYNVKDSKLISQSINVSRLLHCWKLDISFTRRTNFWDYRIVLFNLSLPDALKFQTRDNKRY